MPIYEFQCNACGSRYTKLYRTPHAASEGTAPACPHCQSADTRRLMSSFAVHGTGSGATEPSLSSTAGPATSPVTPKEQLDRWRGAKQKGGA